MPECNSESAGFLNRKLPIKVTDAYLEENPQLHFLLKSLSEKIAYNGNSKKTQEKLVRKMEEVQSMRRKFLNNSVRLACLKEVILDHELNDLTMPAASHEIALVKKLKENITFAEVTSMIDLGMVNGEKVTTLGLSHDTDRLQPRSNAKHTGAQILPMLEDVLYAKCVSILKLLDDDETVDCEANRRQLHPHIIRLSERVAHLVEGVKEGKEVGRDKADEWQQGHAKQLAVLVQIVDQLEVLVKTHYIDTKSKSDLNLSKYLSTKCQTLVLKMRLLEMEILCATYTKDSVKALTKIKAGLDEKIGNAKRELANLNTMLMQYRAAGPEFNHLVVEFSRIQNDIEGKKWALQELTDTNQG